MRGWLAKIHTAQDAEKQVGWLNQSARLIEFLADWQIFAFDQRADPKATTGAPRFAL
jgi:hypothetical protein